MFERPIFDLIQRYKGVLTNNGKAPKTSAMGEQAMAEDGFRGLWEMYVGAAFMKAAIEEGTPDYESPSLLGRTYWAVVGVLRGLDIVATQQTRSPDDPWYDLKENQPEFQQPESFPVSQPLPV